MRKIIRCDGTEHIISAPITMAGIGYLIGAQTMDVIPLRHLGNPLHVMVVDDHGWDFAVVQSGNVTKHVPVKALKPINEKATALYHANCKPGTTHQIVGDVAVVPDDDFGG
jgi:hypothetical protein